MDARNVGDSTSSQRAPRQSCSDTACLRCRHHKIRCSRELPSCERCLQRETSCRYPRPPDRKFLARHRARPYTHRPKGVELQEDRYGPSLPAAGPSAMGERQTGRPVFDSVERGGRLFATAGSPAIQDNRLPERELGLFLIEVYFSHFFTASLLFDYEALVRDYHAQNIPDYVLLAIYAFASLFLRSGSGSPFAKKNALGSFASVGEQGRHWADAASQAVLIKADQPSISKIRASEILAVYWFVNGELHRSAIHASISRESCRLLLQPSNRQRKGPGPQDRESLRMRHAIWIKVCLMDNHSINEAEDGDLALSPEELPSSSPGDVTPATGSTTLVSNSVDWMTWSDDGVRIQNSAVHVMKLFSLWREVRLLVRLTRGARPPSYMQSVFELENKLRKAYAAIPPALLSEDLMSSTYPDVEKTQRNSIHLHSIYHLCLIFLHSSMVQAFSGDQDSMDIPPSLSDSCARSVSQHAVAFTELARKYLATIPDFSKVPCFVGYSAFVAGSVHVVRMDLEENPQNTTPYAHALICRHLLSELKIYYPVLDCLWQALKAQMPRDAIDPLDMPEASLRELVLSPSLVNSPRGSIMRASLGDLKPRHPKSARNRSKRSVIARTFFQLHTDGLVSDGEDESDVTRQEERRMAHGAYQDRSPTSTFENPAQSPYIATDPEMDPECLSKDVGLPQLTTAHDDSTFLYQMTSGDRGLPWFFQDTLMNDPFSQGAHIDVAYGNLLVPSEWEDPLNLETLDPDVIQHIQ